MVQGLDFLDVDKRKGKERFTKVQTMLETKHRSFLISKRETKSLPAVQITSFVVKRSELKRSVVSLHHRSISFEKTEIVSLKFESFLSKFPRNDFREQQH